MNFLPNVFFFPNLELLGCGLSMSGAYLPVFMVCDQSRPRNPGTCTLPTRICKADYLCSHFDTFVDSYLLFG